MGARHLQQWEHNPPAAVLRGVRGLAAAGDRELRGGQRRAPGSRRRGIGVARDEG